MVALNGKLHVNEKCTSKILSHCIYCQTVQHWGKMKIDVLSLP